MNTDNSGATQKENKNKFSECKESVHDTQAKFAVRKKTREEDRLIMALKKVKGNFERMFDKNLTDLVRGIRNNKDNEVILNEFTHTRSTLLIVHPIELFIQWCLCVLRTRAYDVTIVIVVVVVVLVGAVVVLFARRCLLHKYNNVK